MTHKPDAVDAEQTDFDALLREVVKDEILKDARPTLESLKALHADRPLLVLALSQAIQSLTELDALRREVEAGKEKQADFVRITLDAVTEFFSHPGIKELRESLDASATEKLLALEEAFAALEGETR